MRISDVDLLIVPGWMNSGPDHWQSRWEAKLSSARRVAMPDFDRPVCEDWTRALVTAVLASARPVIFAAHSLGVSTIVHAASRLPKDHVAGAFLVAPPDLDAPRALEPLLKEGSERAAMPDGFAPAPRGRLLFPSIVVASRTDPYCDFARAGEMAGDWGAELVDAGDAGHINAASGYGPWPDGVLRLASFLRGLSGSDRACGAIPVQ